jgi:uncharacterized membrane protein
MITFLSPLFLIGVLAAAIPLIIHLSRSRRTKKMRFSTTRFFTDQFLRSYRMSRLKEVLLLVCRMALCGLLATALARPLFLPKGQAFLAGGSRCVVLVMDNSASMGYVEDGKTLLDRARDAARDVLGGLRQGDTASVVLAGRRADGPEALFPEPTPDPGDVRQAVDALTAAPLGTDLSRAVARAETIARASNAASKEVYVLSDLQDSGWELDAADTAAEGSPDVLFFFVHVRPKKVANVAITALQYATARPTVGVPFAIRPHLAVQGDQGDSCTVSLVVDGKKVGERRVDRNRSGRWVVPRFYHTFTTGGWHAGHVEVQDDALPLDNRRYFAFEVHDSVRVLAVDGAPSDVPRLDELFFLKAALTVGPDGKGPVRLDVVGTPDLASADLAKYPLVIVANAEALPAPAVEKLEDFVDRGGSLLFFLGDRVNAPSYNQGLTGPNRLHGGLLPGTLKAVEGNPAGDEGFAFVGEVDYDHPALAAFAEPKFADLAGVSFKALWGVEPGSSAVLMRTNNGRPLLCEKAFGKGRVVLFASTCDRDWTNFPVRPAFLPWVHRLVGYLAQQPLGRQGFYATGDRLLLPVSAAEGLPQLLVKKPDGTTGRPVTGDDAEHPLAFADTGQAGIYTLLGERKENAPLFAVNLEGYESDLTYLDDVLADRDDGRQNPSRAARVEAGLRELLPGRPPELITYVEDPAQVNDVALGARRGVKLWDIVLFVVLILALFEPWLANRISMRLYARPREVAGGTPIRAPATVAPAPPADANQEAASR